MKTRRRIKSISDWCLLRDVLYHFIKSFRYINTAGFHWLCFLNKLLVTFEWSVMFKLQSSWVLAVPGHRLLVTRPAYQPGAARNEQQWIWVKSGESSFSQHGTVCLPASGNARHYPPRTTHKHAYQKEFTWIYTCKRLQENVVVLCTHMIVYLFYYHE